MTGRTELLASLLLCLAMSACSTCHPGPQCLLVVNYYPQETGAWCWAAAGQMVLDYHKISVTQCELVDSQCCPGVVPGQCCAAVPDPCYRGGWPDFCRYGLRFDKTRNAALHWSQVRQQLFCKKLPFTFAWHDGPPNATDGHMYVAIGYDSSAGVNYVEMHDPWPYRQSNGLGGDHAIIPYGIYRDGEPGASHWDDYYNIREGNCP